MDVILVQPKYKLSRKQSRLTPSPLGLLTVATPLDIAGYKVRIINQGTESDWEETLLVELKTNPICVGVTAMTGPQLWWGLKASEMVKKNSDVPVVWGGAHPSLLPQQTLENPCIDIVVQGEGEETFFELVRALGKRQPLDNIRGIWYKQDGKIKQNPPRPFIDLNQQPPLAYHLTDLKKDNMTTISRMDCLRFETSRGCPFNCAFCYNPCFHRRRWRAMTAEQTLLRIKYIIDKYGVKGFAWRDDNFFTNPNRAYQILEGMIRQGFGISWGRGNIRLDLLSQLDDDYLKLIERSGCLELGIGIESGSQRIADLLKKKIDVSQAISVNQRLAGYKMLLRYFFLIGIPGETKADLAETAALILRLLDENPKATAGIHIFTPYPGTELFNSSIQHGLQEPQKLEDWIPFGWSNRRRDYPWLTINSRKLLQMLSLCGHFLTQDKSRRIGSDVTPLVSLAGMIYRPIARRRVAGLHYQFLPELKIAELLGFKGY